MRGKHWIGLALAGLLLTGCLRRYDITLNDGTHLIAHRKPRLIGDSFYFWKEHGRTNVLSASRVREIDALSPWQTPEANPFYGSSAPAR